MTYHTVCVTNNLLACLSDLEIRGKNPVALTTDTIIMWLFTKSLEGTKQSATKMLTYIAMHHKDYQRSNGIVSMASRYTRRRLPYLVIHGQARSCLLAPTQTHINTLKGLKWILFWLQRSL